MAAKLTIRGILLKNTFTVYSKKCALFLGEPIKMSRTCVLNILKHGIFNYTFMVSN